MEAASFSHLQPFFGALGNKDRFSAICLLSQHPHTVTELYKALGVKQNKLSNDLKYLRIRGYVLVEKHGNKRMYSLNPELHELLVVITGQVRELQTICEECVQSHT